MKRLLTNQKENNNLIKHRQKKTVCSQKGKLKLLINTHTHTHTHTHKTSQHHQLTGEQKIKYIYFYQQSGKPFKNELIRHNGKWILTTASGNKN